jgi:Zn-finger nucleic acid-binding protein
MIVEEEKAGRDKGRYLHPELWEQSEDAAIVGSRSVRASGQGSLRRAVELLPEKLRSRVEQHLQALQHGDHVDRHETEKLMGEVKQAARQLYEVPSRIDRAQLEEEWQQVEARLERMRPATARDESGGAGTASRRVSQLLPEQLTYRLEQHLEALQRGHHVDRGELQSLMGEARQQTELHARQGLPATDRSRLEEEWRQVEALVQQLRQRHPWMGAHKG